MINFASKMKNWSYLLLLFILINACKSSYEKVRTSNDPILIYKAANDYYAKKDYIRAQSLFESILTNYRGQKEAEEIYFKYAYCHYYVQEFEMSSHLFKNFSSTFVNSPKKEEAEYMSVYSIYKLSPSYRLDQTSTEKAIDGFQSFANNNPESSRVNECNKIIDELRAKLEVKLLEQGNLYYDLRNYQAAVSSFEHLITEFPETKNQQEVRYLILKSHYELATNSIFEKQEERYKETLIKAEQFLERYKSGKKIAEVKEIKKNTIQKLKNPEYDRYKNSSAGNKS